MLRNGVPDKLKQPFAFIIFGGTGDLSRRKLIPALSHLASLGYMPDKYAVLGTSRSPMTDESFRDVVRQAIQEHSSEDKAGGAPDLSSLIPFIYYQPGDSTKPESFEALKAKLDQLDKQANASRILSPFRRRIRQWQVDQIADDWKKVRSVLEQRRAAERDV